MSSDSRLYAFEPLPEDVNAGLRSECGISIGGKVGILGRPCVPDASGGNASVCIVRSSYVFVTKVAENEGKRGNEGGFSASMSRWSW